MSTQINVHMNSQTEDKGRVTFKVDFDSWPFIVRLKYEDGGPTITGNHDTTMFVDGLSAEGCRSLAGDLARGSEQLFARANSLDGMSMGEDDV